MPISSKLAVRGGFVVGLLIAGYIASSRYSSWRSTHSFSECIHGNGCEGVAVLNGSKMLTSAQLDAIMRSESIRTAVNNVERCYRTQMSGQTVYVLTLHSQNGEEAILLPLLKSSNGEIFSFEALFMDLLNAGAYPLLPKTRTYLDLYNHKISLVGPLIPEMKSAGIDTVILAGQTIPTDQIPEVLADRARGNTKRQIAVIRP